MLVVKTSELSVPNFLRGVLNDSGTSLLSYVRVRVLLYVMEWYISIMRAIF